MAFLSVFLLAPDRRFLQATQSCDGNLGSDHIYHGRKIDSTFLTVAKQPKNVNTYAIPKLLENISYGLKVFYAGHMLQFLLDSLSVVVG